MAKYKKINSEEIEKNLSEIKKIEKDDNEHTLDKHNPLDKYEYKSQIGTIVNSCKYRQQYVDDGLILSVNHLKQFFFAGSGKNYSKLKAVHNVSFTVKKGETYGLIGDSGCGKTVIAQSIVRYFNITSGSIYYKGYRIGCGSRWNEKEIKWTKVRYKDRLRELKKQLKEKSISKETYKLECKKAKDYKDQVVNIQRNKIKAIKYDNSHVDKRLLNEIHLAFRDTRHTVEPNRSINDVLKNEFIIRGLPVDESRIAYALNLVGIPQTELIHKVIDLDDYNFNMVEIARAIVHNTKLLICDEIDEEPLIVRDHTFNKLEEIKKKEGLTIIYISKNNDLVNKYCDHVAYMKAGEIINITDVKKENKTKKVVKKVK